MTKFRAGIRALTKKNVDNMASKVNRFDYDRTKVSSGIVHIGVGNFHRAHEEYYTDRLLALPGNERWGITGAMLMPGDEKLYRALDSQDGVYSLTVCGRAGNDEVYEIGSLKGVVWAGDNPDEIISLIANPDTHIVSLTITEGGYNIDKATGEFQLNNPAILHDLEDHDSPRTAFGFIAAGLTRRMHSGAGRVTILSCDNLQHNGDTARKAFMAFFEAYNPRLAEWARENVTFPNSMVDRITPATLPADVQRLNKENGTADAAPVYCEDFVQWVIEDKFTAGRPAWERVGVQFTDDVTAFENMKLSLLNASHTLLSYPAFLAGYRKVDEAMRDGRLVQFVRDFMDIDVTPYVPAPENTDLAEYKQTLVERFGNRSVSDQVARLCADGISKFPVYIMPNMEKMLADGKDLRRLAFLIAAYRHYLKYKVDDAGVPFEINEPWMTPHDEALALSDDPVDFLDFSAFAGAPLRKNANFVDIYLDLVRSIAEDGAMKTMTEL